MSLKIYNTLTRQKELFEPLSPKQVSLYVCGPTVYSNAHVGHGMSVVVFDIIRRYLEYLGYQVKHVMNYTDVDDKIIQRANAENIPPIELAERYIEEFDEHLVDLNVLPADVFPRASETMDQIIDMVKNLVEAGYAYEIEGDVYFRVKKDEDYGKLSRRKIEDMRAGTRIEADERKEDQMDFALWKAAKPGEPAWESPWGPGRPGWHIECSAMNLAHLGPQIDIHGGGNDLIFPHHENEIAQTESLTGKQPFARFWVHNGMLQLSGEKMSKSVGNLITIEEFLAEHEADVFRLIILNASYRSPVTFTDETIYQAERALERLRSALRPAQPKHSTSTTSEEALNQQMEKTRQGFAEAMNDDFNTAGALGQIFELVRAINQARDAGASAKNVEAAQTLLHDLTGVLGLRLERTGGAADRATAPFVDLLVKIRSDLREQKLWGLADEIRDRLNELGVLVEDSAEGSSWRWQ